MKKIDDILLQVIETLIDKKLSKIWYDKTFPTVVYGKNEDGTYKIPKDGVLYNVPNGLGVDLKNGQHVWVTIPCGEKNFKNMYISGLRK